MQTESEEEKEEEKKEIILYLNSLFCLLNGFVDLSELFFSLFLALKNCMTDHLSTNLLMQTKQAERRKHETIEKERRKQKIGAKQD